MPGNPCPADRNDPGRDELETEATPWTVLTEGVFPVDDGAISEDVSTPACKLWVEGF